MISDMCEKDNPKQVWNRLIKKYDSYCRGRVCGSDVLTKAGWRPGTLVLEVPGTGRRAGSEQNSTQERLKSAGLAVIITDTCCRTHKLKNYDRQTDQPAAAHTGSDGDLSSGWRCNGCLRCHIYGSLISSELNKKRRDPVDIRVFVWLWINFHVQINVVLLLFTI